MHQGSVFKYPRVAEMDSPFTSLAVKIVLVLMLVNVH